MEDIVVSAGWRNLIGSMARRRDAWLVVGAVVAIVVVAVALKARAPEARIAPPARAPSVPSSPVAAVIVHVAGAVRSPGIYELTEGARVADAIAAAGGPTRRAALDALNLAEVVTDGTKIEVVSRGTVAPPLPAASPAPADTAPGAPVSINSADQLALEAIPGIGPVKAAAIIAYREEAGGFSSIEELLEVTGIGPATLEALRPYVTL